MGNGALKVPAEALGGLRVFRACQEVNEVGTRRCIVGHLKAALRLALNQLAPDGLILWRANVGNQALIRGRTLGKVGLNLKLRLKLSDARTPGFTGPLLSIRQVAVIISGPIGDAFNVT
jgi:hypothetical protein